MVGLECEFRVYKLFLVMGFWVFICELGRVGKGGNGNESFQGEGL